MIVIKWMGKWCLEGLPSTRSKKWLCLNCFLPLSPARGLSQNAELRDCMWAQLQAEGSEREGSKSKGRIIKNSASCALDWECTAHAKHNERRWFPVFRAWRHPPSQCGTGTCTASSMGLCYWKSPHGDEQIQFSHLKRIWWQIVLWIQGPNINIFIGLSVNITSISFQGEPSKYRPQWCLV